MHACLHCRNTPSWTSLEDNWAICHTYHCKGQQEGTEVCVCMVCVCAHLYVGMFVRMCVCACVLACKYVSVSFEDLSTVGTKALLLARQGERALLRQELVAVSCVCVSFFPYELEFQTQLPLVSFLKRNAVQEPVSIITFWRHVSNEIKLHIRILTSKAINCY